LVTASVFGSDAGAAAAVDDDEEEAEEEVSRDFFGV